MQLPSSCAVRKVSTQGSVRKRPASVCDSRENEAKHWFAMLGPEATSDYDTSRAVDSSRRRASIAVHVPPGIRIRLLGKAPSILHDSRLPSLPFVKHVALNISQRKSRNDGIFNSFEGEINYRLLMAPQGGPHDFGGASGRTGRLLQASLRRVCEIAGKQFCALRSDLE